MYLLGLTVCIDTSHLIPLIPAEKSHLMVPVLSHIIQKKNIASYIISPILFYNIPLTTDISYLVSRMNYQVLIDISPLIFINYHILVWIYYSPKRQNRILAPINIFHPIRRLFKKISYITLSQPYLKTISPYDFTISEFGHPIPQEFPWASALAWAKAAPVAMASAACRASPWEAGAVWDGEIFIHKTGPKLGLQDAA